MAPERAASSTPLEAVLDSKLCLSGFGSTLCSLVNFCDLKRDIHRKERFSPAVKKHKVAMGFGQISVQAGLKVMAQIRTNSLLFKENLQS